MIWSRLAPTMVLNLLIWGLGTLYCWAVNEKVSGLREAYRQLQQSERRLDKARRPLVTEQKRLHAFYNRERAKNQVVVREHAALLERAGSMLQMLQRIRA
jgi:hypothetical protein